MKLILGLVAALLVTACGSDTGERATVGPAVGVSPAPSGSMPTAIPAAPGTVDTLGLVTVMDSGTGGPELCLGPIAESYPPQCSGPEITGWSWADHRGTYDQHGQVKWGQYALSGTWDGTTFGVESAVAAPVYDAMPLPSVPPGTPVKPVSPAELARIQDEVGQLPGAQVVTRDHGQVVVTVTYDDGSLQDWADGEYGDGTVVVTSLLVDPQTTR